MTSLNLQISFFYFGYSLVYFSTIDIETLMKIFNVDMAVHNADGLLKGCIPVGGGIGALGSYIFIKKFSRRYKYISI